MLAASEFNVNEPLPLHRIHEAIFRFCQGRTDAVVFGAQAVNAYVRTPRMTQDVDLLSAAPAELARELADALAAELHVAIRVRELAPGRSYRVYQSRKDGSRHLADVRLATHELESFVTLNGIRYVGLPTLVALKVRSLAHRRLSPKGATDLADLRRLLLAHPDLRRHDGDVERAITALGAEASALEAWRALVAEPPVPDEDVDEDA